MDSGRQGPRRASRSGGMTFAIRSGGERRRPGFLWDYRKVLLAHEIKDITGHYSAPGLKLLLEEAEKITRQGAMVLRAVTQNATQGKGCRMT